METGAERMNGSALSTSANIQWGEHRKMVWNRIPCLLRVAVSLIYEAAILKLISTLLGL